MDSSLSFVCCVVSQEGSWAFNSPRINEFVRVLKWIRRNWKLVGVDKEGGMYRFMEIISCLWMRMRVVLISRVFFGIGR